MLEAPWRVTENMIDLNSHSRFNNKTANDYYQGMTLTVSESQAARYERPSSKYSNQRKKENVSSNL